jgi:hypothetical protein
MFGDGIGELGWHRDVGFWLIDRTSSSPRKSFDEWILEVEKRNVASFSL